jgi:hypothetical protein
LLPKTYESMKLIPIFECLYILMNNIKLGKEVYI